MIKILEGEVGGGTTRIAMMVPRFNAIGAATDTTGHHELHFSLSDHKKFVQVVLSANDAAELMIAWLLYAKRFETLSAELWNRLRLAMGPDAEATPAARGWDGATVSSGQSETGDEARRSIVAYLERWADTHERDTKLPSILLERLALELREAARAIGQGVDRIRRVPLQPKGDADGA